jgi:apolipoprotein N-acyltransferase
LVQGGGEQGTRAIYTDSREVVERHLAATATIEPGVAMVVWPENVIDVPTFATSAERAEIAAQAQRLGAPIAVGITEDVTIDGDRRFLNAQVVVEPDGTITSRYDKVRRVPFGEYVPLRGLLEAIGAPTNLVPRNAVAGTEPAVLRTADGITFSTVISWEVFFGGRANEGVERGGTFIVNPTNGSSYTTTILQSQQVASSRLRAVEQDRMVFQVAPTGYSAVVFADGRVTERTNISEQRVLYSPIIPSNSRTLYSYVGDRPFVLACLAGLLFAGWRTRRDRLGDDRQADEPTPVTARASG